MYSYAPWVLGDTPLCVCVCLCEWIMYKWDWMKIYCKKYCFYYILDPFTKSQHVFIRTASRMNREVPVVEKENTADQMLMKAKQLSTRVAEPHAYGCVAKKNHRIWTQESSFLVLIYLDLILKFRNVMTFRAKYFPTRVWFLVV